MSARTHTWDYSGPAPLAPYRAHAAPMSAQDVAALLGAMRDRYLHLTDTAAWDGNADIAAHMAAGVKLCLDDLELRLRIPSP